MGTKSTQRDGKGIVFTYHKPKDVGSDLLTKEYPLSKKVLENLPYIHRIFTFTERIIFNVISNLETAYTTKEIRGFYILRIAEDVMNNKYRQPVDSEKCIEFRVELHGRRGIIKTKTDFINWSERKLKEMGIKIASFKTIDSILQTFEKLGIVTRRYDPERKGKYLWCLTLEFMKQWEALEVEIERKTKERERKTWRLF